MAGENERVRTSGYAGQRVGVLFDLVGWCAVNRGAANALASAVKSLRSPGLARWGPASRCQLERFLAEQQSSTPSPNLESVGQRVQLLRDLVNAPRVQRQLMANRSLWFRLGSAMDALEDTDQAIAAHRTRAWESSAATVGLRYLAHYGFLQSAFVQQDAVFTVCEVLGVTIDREQFPKLREIRELRNDAIGHPTGRRDGSSHAIVQVSMTADRFELGSWSRDGWTRRPVDLDEVAAEQHNGMVQVLDHVVTHLAERDRRHKEQFVNRPLAPMLAQSNLGYALEKISVGARVALARPGGGEVALAEGGLGVVNQMLHELEDALRERGEFPDVYDTVDHLLSELHAAVDRLGATFAGRPGGLDPRASARCGNVCFMGF